MCIHILCAHFHSHTWLTKTSSSSSPMLSSSSHSTHSPYIHPNYTQSITYYNFSNCFFFYSSVRVCVSVPCHAMPCRATALCSCGLFGRIALHIVPFSIQPKQADERVSRVRTMRAPNKPNQAHLSTSQRLMKIIYYNERKEFVATSPYTCDEHGSKY